MRKDHSLVGSPSRQSVEHFGEARIVSIARGRCAIWLNPFGMLDPQVVVNLVLELGIGVDLVIHGYWPGERFKCAGGQFPKRGSPEWRTDMGAVSARHNQVRIFQRSARMCSRCARRQANWIIL
jgi:hypothetical protein